MATPTSSAVASATQPATPPDFESTARTPGAGTRGTYTPAFGYGIVDADAATAAP